MNEIAKSQNDKNYLMFQYSARKCYNYAEKVNYLAWIVCLFGCIYGMIDAPYKNVVGPLISTLSLLMQICVHKNHSLGAAFREYIDYSLFRIQHSMTYNGIDINALCAKACSICRRNIDEAEEQFRNTGKDRPKGVKDWYEDIDEISNHNEAVFSCQKQNRYWDERISVTYLNIITFVIIAIALVAISITFRFNGIFDYLCGVVFPFAAVILKAVLETRDVKKYIKRSIELDTLIQNHSSPITDEEIRRIQSVIDMRRSMFFIVPNLLHKILSSRIQDEQRIINQ